MQGRGANLLTRKLISNFSSALSCPQAMLMLQIADAAGFNDPRPSRCLDYMEVANPF